MLEKYIVLDTNILVRFPLVLALVRHKSRLIVPRRVLSEMAGAGHDSLLHLILSRQIRVTAEKDQIILADLMAQHPGISLTDAEVLLCALDLTREEPRGAIVATEDRQLREAADLHDIQSLSAAQIKTMLQEVGAVLDEAIAEPIRSSIRADRKELVTSFMSGGALATLGTLLYINAQTVIPWMEQYLRGPGIAVGLFAVGAGLYWVRTKHRIGYAVAEIIAGTVMAFLAYTCYGEIDPPAMTVAFKTAAGLYVIVRGLDNVKKGLSPRQRYLWETFFGRDEADDAAAA